MPGAPEPIIDKGKYMTVYIRDAEGKLKGIAAEAAAQGYADIISLLFGITGFRPSLRRGTFLSGTRRDPDQEDQHQHPSRKTPARRRGERIAQRGARGAVKSCQAGSPFSIESGKPGG